ncbi:6-phosphogluconolactonase (cycloisomerase 2 family) [Algoriphagus boseongensis]|uniref:6-phosphogluconolactonase (Cycloisomerase 2 family) n=1 Tax=Algoriphagus boseongensis TaxID=1442587 RepID=A0A4R6TA97_9BACT|nr:lactonase family protein [Algoriphagus boseongensis]TDQ19696.1 6-phosphogluconolactonase (cycloisomerase 2 family) [Algoriphagus boseongensis]
MKFNPYLGLFSTAIALTASCSSPNSTESTVPPVENLSYEFLVGTYTDSINQGINHLYFSPSENLMTVETIAAGVANPSFVIATKDGKRVYSLEEEAGIQGGNVLSFSRNPEDGSLTLLDQDESKGDHPCHISISPNEDFIILGNYTGGSLSIFKVGPEGQLDFVQLFQHTGKSINPDRQEKPHVHSTTFDPEGKRVLVADLGTDKIYVYDFNPENSEPLSLSYEFPVTPGDGPRHLAFSADGKEVLVVEEMAASMDVFSYEEGKLTPKQRLSLLDEGFTGNVGAAEIRISPDGKHVYVSNRGDANTISVFGKNQNGEYERIQNISSGGLMPRNFNLTGDGKYLLAAHQASNDIVIFERDSETGKLTQTLWKATIHKPVYLFRLSN